MSLISCFPATVISVDSGRGSSATGSRRSSQSTVILPRDSKSVQSFTSDQGIVRDAGSLNSLNSSVSQMKQGEFNEGNSSLGVKHYGTSIIFDDNFTKFLSL